MSEQQQGTTPQQPGRTAVTWFEIPCLDLDRARVFYQSVLGTTLPKDDFGDSDDVMCVFPAERPGITGALVCRPLQKPRRQGTMVYLNCDGFLDAAIDRAHRAGGSVIVPKTAVPGGMGHYACICDSEGNHVGLHSA